MSRGIVRALGWGGLTLAACFVALLALAGQQPGSIDDAFVLLVYARHLAESGEVYYNLGEGSVDGFTSGLDLVLKALAIRLFPRDPVAVTWWVTVGSYLATVVAGVALVARRTDLGARQRTLWKLLLGALAVTLTPGLAEGASYLLETPLFLLAILGVVGSTVLSRRPSDPAAALAPLALFALVLARPEGLPLALWFGALWWLRPGRRGARTASVAAFLVLSVAFYAWRIRTFGHWAPNSYHAKTSALRWNEVRHGLLYVGRFGGSLGGVAALGGILVNLALAALGRWDEPEARRAHRTLTGAALIALGVTIWSGGDSYLGARLLAPATLLAILATHVAALHLRGLEAVAPLAVLVTVAGAGLREAGRDAPAKLTAIAQGAMVEDDFACSREISRRLAAVVPDARVAQHDFQRFKYFSDATYVLDTSGLNSRRVAHVPVEAPVYFAKDGIETALDESIEILHVDFRWTSAEAMADYSVGDLLASPRIGRRFLGTVYSGKVAERLAGYRTASMPHACGDAYFNFLVRADLAQRFRDAGFLVGGP